MRNKIKNVIGNIQGLGIYCFKANGKVLYVGSGMMNDRLTNHLYHLKRNKYVGTNKAILQKYYDMEELEFEVLHFSKHNKEYLDFNIAQKEDLFEVLSTLEKLYIDMYKDTICNKQLRVSCHSSNRNRSSTLRRRKANLGERNPNKKYSEELVENILWLKENTDLRNREIADLILDKLAIEISPMYVANLGETRWIQIQAKNTGLIVKDGE